MSSSLTVSSDRLVLGWDFTRSQPYGTDASAAGTFQFTPDGISNGTGAGQADTLYVDQVTVPANGSSVINLLGMPDPILDESPNNCLSKVKGLYFEHLSTSDSSGVVVGGHAVSPFEDWSTAADSTLVLKPGMSFYLGNDSTAGGMTVDTSSWAILLRNQDASEDAEVRVRIVGVSGTFPAFKLDHSVPNQAVARALALT